MRHLSLILIGLLLNQPLTAATPATADPIRKGYDLYYRGDMMPAYELFATRALQDPRDLAAAYGALSAVYARNRMEQTLEDEFERRSAELIEHAENRYDADPNDLDALFFLAQTHGLRAGHYFERRERLFRSARDAAKSKGYSDEYVRRNPTHADAYIALGLYNYYSDLAPALLKVIRYLLFIPGGDRKLGLQQIERAARQARMWSPQARMELIRIYTWTEGRVDEGLRLADEMQRQYPDNAELAFRLARMASGPVLEDAQWAGTLYARMRGRWLLGESDYSTAVHVRAVLGLAEIRAQQWRMEESVRLLSGLLESHRPLPVWAHPELLLARAKYAALLDDPAALKDLRRVSDNPAWKEYSARAESQLSWTQSRRASGEAARFVRLLPGNRMAAGRRFGEARAFYEKVREDAPDDLQVRFRLARLSFLEGSHAEAERTFVTLRNSLRGTDPAWLRAGVLLHLARLHDLAGRREAAVGLYERIAEHFDESPEALAARIGMLNPYRPVELARR